MNETSINYEVNIEQVSNIERKLDVEVPWDDVKGRLDEAYRELGKGVVVKGFRKGKVPRQMLEKLFGQHVNQEVAQRLVQESIAKAITDNEISPVSEPKVDDEGIQSGNAFRYSAVLQVVPEVEPDNYFGVEVTQRPPKVSDDAVERGLFQKRNAFTQYKPVKGRATTTGDVLMVDLMGKVDGKPYAQEQQIVELSEPPQEPIPGLAAKLTGLGEDERELDVSLEIPIHDHGPDEPCSADEKVVEARLLVTIQDVKQKIVPELNDEFAKETGEAETLDELRDNIRAELLKEDESQAKREAQQGMVDKLLEINDVPVVPALVDRHLQSMLQLQAAFMGGNAELLQDESIKERLRKDSERTVRSALLLDAIGKKEEIKVDDADVEKRLAELASERDENLARLRAQYEEKGQLDQLRERLREEKTLDLLMSKAKISIQEPADDKADSADAQE